jgi:hypothetical protein
VSDTEDQVSDSAFVSDTSDEARAVLAGTMERYERKGSEVAAAHITAATWQLV